MPQHQQTFDEVRALSQVSFLNRTQQKVLKLIAHQMTQSQIAARLKISRQYVNQIVGKLTRIGILKKRGKSHWVVRFWRQSEAEVVTANRQLCNSKAEAEEFAKKIATHSVKPPEIEFQKSSTCYNVLYDVPEHLKRQVEQAAPEVQVSACRVHNIRLKYTYGLDGTINTSRKTGYIKSWAMRGGDRHKFLIPGRTGYPDIMIDVHPGTLIAYPDGGQTMAAETVEEVETVTRAAIHEAITEFAGRQTRHGVRIAIHRPANTGRQVTQTHYGFPFPDNSPYAAEQTRLPGFWIDHSPEGHGLPGHAEIETLNSGAASALDAGIHKILNLESILARTIPTAMNDFMERTLSPQLQAIQALQQGGITLQQKVDNLTQILAAMLLKNERLEAQMINLKGEIE